MIHFTLIPTNPDDVALKLDAAMRPACEIICPQCGGEAAFLQPTVAFFVPGPKTGRLVFEDSVRRMLRGIPSPARVLWSRHSRGQLIVNLYSDLLGEREEYWCGNGVCRCPECGRRARHTLDWPREAYFQCEVRGSILWAATREDLGRIRDYIASTRRQKAYVYRKLPRTVLLASNRTLVLKRIDELLAPDRPDRRAARRARKTGR